MVGWGDRNCHAREVDHREVTHYVNKKEKIVTIEFVTVCAWCRKELKRYKMESKVYIHDVVSHGICRKCKRTELKKFRRQTTA